MIRSIENDGYDLKIGLENVACKPTEESSSITFIVFEFSAQLSCCKNLFSSALIFWGVYYKLNYDRRNKSIRTLSMHTIC